MKIAVLSSHVGSSGLNPPGNHGGGEAATFGFLHQLRRYYDVELIIPTGGIYPGIDNSKDYGYDVSQIKWSPIGPSMDWLRKFDCLIVIDHNLFHPPICKLNILYTFFPQYPNWDVSGYQYVVADSKFAAKWAKTYWGRDAEVIYPPINLEAFDLAISGDNGVKVDTRSKKPVIASIGRFFEVPGGNNKRHDVIISAFKDMSLPDAELHLIGAVLDPSYYAKIRELAGDDSRIKFLHDLNRAEYTREIREATFVWSATGYEASQPSSYEHFGIFVNEAHAAGCIVMAHNSGGPVELGCMLWEDPADLASKTLEIIHDNELLRETQIRSIEQADRFLTEQASTTMIDLLNRAVAFSPDPEQFKIYWSSPRNSDIKIGVISDSPYLTLGFGNVTQQVVTGLLGQGFKVACLGVQDSFTGAPNEPNHEAVLDFLNGYENFTFDEVQQAVTDANAAHVPVWRDWAGANHGDLLARFIEAERPDVLYIQYDFGYVRTVVDVMRSRNIDIPFIAHIPIEGEPIIDGHIETLRLIRIMNGTPLTYTEWGAGAVKSAGGPAIDWVHLGADHANFAPLPEHRRNRLREAIGWKDHFVIAFGGRNKRTKGFSHLLSAMQMLENLQAGKFLAYLHTNVRDTMPNSSLPLDQITRLMGLENVVIFPSDLTDQRMGPDYETGTQLESPDTDDINQVYAENLKALSLIERLACADVFVCASEVEGFNLWLVEAMGCGLPIICVDDEGVQREIIGNAGIFVPVAHWDMWHTGVRLAQADPKDLARAIIDVNANKTLQCKLSQASLDRYENFQWQTTVDKITHLIAAKMGR